MTQQDPITMLDAEFDTRRTSLRFPPIYDGEAKAPLEAVASARQALDGAAAEVARIHQRRAEGLIADDQVPRLAARIADEAEQVTKSILGAAQKTLAVLPNRLDAEAWPSVVSRTIDTEGAKADLRLALDATDDATLADTFAAQVKTALTAGDHTAAQVAMSSWGRQYLRNRLKTLPDRDFAVVWSGIRDQVTPVAAEHGKGLTRKASAVMADMGAITQAFQAGREAVLIRVERLKDAAAVKAGR